MHDNASPADVVFVNGAIATLDSARPQAEAVAVKDERIVAVGGNAEIKRHAGSATEVVDLGGRRVVPGLIDAHCHPVETLWMKDDWVDARFPHRLGGQHLEENHRTRREDEEGRLDFRRLRVGVGEQVQGEAAAQ